MLEGGVSEKNVHVFAEPAFGLDPIFDSSRANEILKREEITLSSRPTVGVLLRHMYYQWNERDVDEYGGKMAALCDHMIEKWGVQILFIPNQTYSVDTPNEDDRVMCKYIISRMTNKAHAFQIKNEYFLKDTLSLFHKFEMMITNRRHSCVFGAIHNKAVIGLDTKCSWNIGPVVQEALELPGQLLNFIELDLETLKQKFDSSWENRASLSQHIATRVPVLREKARAQVDLIAELIKKGIR